MGASCAAGTSPRLDSRRAAIVRFRGPSLWSDYKREVLGVLSALILQSLLIVGLLYQRRARQRAETREPEEPGTRR